MKTLQKSFRFLIFVFTFSFIVLQANAQGGFVRKVEFAPFPAGQSDITLVLNNRNGKRNPFYSNPDEYRTVGVYRVKGNPFLLRGDNSSDVFMTQGYAKAVKAVYDLQTQQFSVVIENGTQMMTIAYNELDSFRVNMDSTGLITTPATFVNVSKLDKGNKPFLQRLASNDRYTLYKSYKIEMVPTGDIAQTNLQQFEVVNEFFYFDKTESKGIRKIKANASFLKDEFKNDKEATALLNNMSFNKETKEASLLAFFKALK